MVTTIVYNRLVIEEMVELFLGHALSCILNGDLYAIFPF